MPNSALGRSLDHGGSFLTGKLFSFETMIKKLPIMITLLLVAAALFVATQWDLWRTGRDELVPLALVSGGPAVKPMSRVWIDTDAACGATARTDPDDCLAILWLVSREADIAGISTSFGNASGTVVKERVRALAAEMAGAGLRVPLIFDGYAEPSSGDTRQPPGVIALQAALASGPLTILALGPMTNVAAALEGRPDLQRNVERIVAVMGHQRGHLFHPSEGKGRNALFGHGPIFPDLNLTADPDAAQTILAMQLPVTLIPYDAARATLITAADLDRLTRRGRAHAWVAQTARAWLTFWKDVVGLPGFYPFDWIAAAYLAHPDLFDCAPVEARVTREWTFGIVPHQSLVVDAATDGQGQRKSKLLYCPRTDASLHDVLTD
jgi:inosine-uridine nucleoside N-ribohydrolase